MLVTVLLDNEMHPYLSAILGPREAQLGWCFARHSLQEAPTSEAIWGLRLGVRYVHSESLLHCLPPKHPLLYGSGHEVRQPRCRHAQLDSDVAARLGRACDCPRNRSPVVLDARESV